MSLHHPWEFYRGWLVQQQGRRWEAFNKHWSTIRGKSKKDLFQRIDDQEAYSTPPAPGPAGVEAGTRQS